MIASRPGLYPSVVSTILRRPFTDANAATGWATNGDRRKETLRASPA
ncbi:hypothetical protein [Nocardia ninae]|nr:hypothetical protein [Nocardia ninae]